MRILEWSKTAGIIAAFFVFYLAVALLVSGLTTPMAGMMVSGVVTAAAVLAFRIGLLWRLTGAVEVRDEGFEDRRFWVLVIAAVLLCWSFGNSAAELFYASFGSAGYDAAQQTDQQISLALVLLNGIALAPIVEESLVRGMAYPLLRRHMPPIAAAVITAAGFAALHGNMVQAIATLPLGILLAFVYERTQKLVPVIGLHIGYNMLSVLAPPGTIDMFASSVLTVILLGGLCLTAITVLRPRL